MSRPTFEIEALVRVAVTAADDTPAAREAAHGLWCAMLKAMSSGELPSDVGPIFHTGMGRYSTYVRAADCPSVRTWLRARAKET